MFEIGHMIYWIKRTGWRKWALMDGSGRELVNGSRQECFLMVDGLRRAAARS